MTEPDDKSLITDTSTASCIYKLSQSFDAINFALGLHPSMNKAAAKPFIDSIVSYSL